MAARTLALIYILVSFPLAFPQQRASSDHQAVLLRDVLTRAVATAGGQDALASVQDLTESGEITFHWAKDVVGPVVIESIGSNHFRMDADLPSGRQTWTVKNGAGKRKEGALEFPISHAHAINLENLTFPAAHLVAALADGKTQISLVGIEKQNDRSVYRLRLDGMLGLVEKKEQGALTSKEVLVDALTFDILSIGDYPCVIRSAHSEKASAAPPREIEYGDFRSVNGVRLPFLISTILNGERTLTIRIHDVSFNSNVPDADFDVALQHDPR